MRIRGSNTDSVFTMRLSETVTIFSEKIHVYVGTTCCLSFPSPMILHNILIGSQRVSKCSTLGKLPRILVVEISIGNVIVAVIRAVG